MKFITNILKKLNHTKDIPISLGRWKIEDCNIKMYRKIDLSNEDHCGPCGQYEVEKVNIDLNKNIYLDNPK